MTHTLEVPGITASASVPQGDQLKEGASGIHENVCVLKMEKGVLL